MGANLFFILTISLLSWYHWSDSVWVEETRQRIRDRVDSSRRKPTERGPHVGAGDGSSYSEGSKSLADDEDISVIDEDSLHHQHAFYNENDDSDGEGVEELGNVLDEAGVRKRRPELSNY